MGLHISGCLPVITAPRDAIGRITHRIICGSDLHMYAGELNAAMEKGDIMGYEAIGSIEEIRSRVKYWNAGNRVIILPYSLCDRTNPSKMMVNMYGNRLAGIFDYSHLTGGYPGDLAEYRRVLNADLTCVNAPKNVTPEKLRPVGLLIQHLAKLRDEQRLAIAKTFGMIPIDVPLQRGPAEYILVIESHGLDRGIEASDFRNTNSIERKVMRKARLEGGSLDTVSADIKATREFENVAFGEFFNTSGFPIGMMMEKLVTVCGGPLMAQMNLFENIAKNYDVFFRHEIPRGLKPCLVTAYNRSSL
ncbi:GroES-like protein [Glonium stellatum]|uniref:GroES-like protein n=1 Tax=Glonium stellatum TaxID=574774 RepID=A0A8E2EXC9_9PEZI|nr:GroES-like protein [Glonium stellatum]